MRTIASGKTPHGAARACALFLTLAFWLQAFCPGQGRDKFLKVFFPGGRSVRAELAVNDEERARGLMFRDQLMADQGMLFVFAEDEPHSFWMKNTLIPLDMLWLGSDRRIIHIEKNVPPC